MGAAVAEVGAAEVAAAAVGAAEVALVLFPPVGRTDRSPTPKHNTLDIVSSQRQQSRDLEKLPRKIGMYASKTRFRRTVQHAVLPQAK